MNKNTTNEDYTNNITFGEMFDRDSKNYLIAHLDMMGYRDYIERNGEKELFTSVKKAWDFANGLMRPSITMSNGDKLEFEIGSKMFTDNILIYTELKGDGHDELRIFIMIALIAYFQNSILKFSNILLRGSIVQGNCYIGDFILGRPFLEAYDVESKKAGWSRIIISEDVLKNIQPDFAKISVKKDEDGLFFLDYLQIIAEFSCDSGDGAHNVLVEHRENVISIAKNTFHTERFIAVRNVGDAIKLVKISRVYGLLTDYHNDLCDKYGCKDAKMETAKPSAFPEQYGRLLDKLNKIESPEEFEDLNVLLLNVKNSFGELINPVIKYRAQGGDGQKS